MLRPPRLLRAVLAPKSKWKAVVLSQLASPNAREVAGVGRIQGNENGHTLQPDAMDQSRQLALGSPGAAIRRDNASAMQFAPPRRLQATDPFIL